MNIKIKKLKETVKLPTRGSKEAACYDLYAHYIENYGNTAIVHLDFATEIPEGYKAVIVPRSSITKTSWILQNSPAQIDSDYRGPWMLKYRAIPKDVTIAHRDDSLASSTYNIMSYEQFPYETGDRVAQMYIEKVIDCEFDLINELESTERGDGGFGSTGK